MGSPSVLTKRQVAIVLGVALSGAGALVLMGSGAIQSAYSLIENSGTPLTRRQTLNFAGSAVSCADASPVTTCTVSGSSSGGGGLPVFSGSAVTLVGTQYIPIGGGASISSTEATVEVKAPATATVSNLSVQLSAALGTGNSTVFTWRDAASGTTLTCTISGASATTCQDTTHSFTATQGDEIDIQAVTTGTPGAVTLVIATQYGASGGSGTLSVSGFYLYDGTNYYIGPQQNVAILPSASSFSWLTTQGSNSTATVRNALTVSFASNGAAANVRCYGTAINSAVNLTVALSFQGVPTNFIYTGIAFYESATGKLETLFVPWNPGSSSSNAPGSIQVFSWTNQTTFGSTLYSSMSGVTNGDFRWYRLNYTRGSPGTISYSYSTDGQKWTQVYSENANSFFTTAPDNWCVAADPEDGALAETVYSWQAQ
jgi:hypothetical protein